MKTQPLSGPEATFYVSKLKQEWENKGKLKTYKFDAENWNIEGAAIKRVPRPWLTFVQDATNELKKITSLTYDGTMSKGMRNGFGSLIMDNGDIYKGNWKNDTRYGAGLCQFANGTIYKGDWKDDMPHGIGTFFTGPGELIEAKF